MKYLLLGSGCLFLMQSWLMASQLTYAMVLAAYCEQREALEHAKLIKEEQDHDAQFLMPAADILVWLRACLLHPDDLDLALHEGYDQGRLATPEEFQKYQELEELCGLEEFYKTKLLRSSFNPSEKTGIVPPLCRSVDAQTPFSPLPGNSMVRLPRGIGACTPEPENRVVITSRVKKPIEQFL